MKNYIEQIKDYLGCQPTEKEGALLEILYFAYLDRNTGDKHINTYFALIDACTHSLSFEKSNEIINAAVSLCAEQERIAFVDGVRVGAKLVIELMEL